VSCGVCVCVSLHKRPLLDAPLRCSGWPDESYWQRLASELAAVGVYDEEFASEASEAAAAKRKQAPGGAAGPAIPAAAPSVEAGADAKDESESESEMVAAAFEAVLSLPALEEDQRNALQQMHTAEVANPRLGLEHTISAMLSYNRTEVGRAVCRARCEVVVLRLLRACTAAQHVELNRVQGELDRLGTEIQELVRLEREAMSARLIPRMRELMAERAQKSQQRDAIREAADKTAIATAFEHTASTGGAIGDGEEQRPGRSTIEQELQRWHNEAADIKAELHLQVEEADDEDEVV
jgi:hypothetical protein